MERQPSNGVSAHNSEGRQSWAPAGFFFQGRQMVSRSSLRGPIQASERGEAKGRGGVGFLGRCCEPTPSRNVAFALYSLTLHRLRLQTG